MKLHVNLYMVFLLETKQGWLHCSLSAHGVLLGDNEFSEMMLARVAHHTVLCFVDAHDCPVARLSQ